MQSWDIFKLIYRASEKIFFEKELIEAFLTDSHHCQTSFVGKAESFNALFRNSQLTEFTKKFVLQHEGKCGDIEVEDNDTEDVLDCENANDDMDENACPQFKKTFFWEMNRQKLSAAILLKLTIEEAIERHVLHEEYFGPKTGISGRRITL